MNQNAEKAIFSKAATAMQAQQITLLVNFEYEHWSLSTREATI